jgi:hypothetical protein
VNEWSSSKIKIQNESLHNIKICRTSEYFVDTSSIEILELGTKAYPYKSIRSPFIEVLNLHSHSTRQITINLMESTINYLPELSSYIINTTSVTLKPYSNTLTTPRSSELFIYEFFPFSTSPTTKFSILSSSTLRLAEVLSHPDMTKTDRNIASITSTGVVVNRGSLFLQDLVVKRDVMEDSKRTTRLIRAVNLQHHEVRIERVQFYMSGRILLSAEPMNLYVKDVYIDFYGLLGAFYISALWNYPEAQKTGEIYFSNITAVNSQSSIITNLYGILFYSGPANVTVDDANIQIYGTQSFGQSQLEFLITPDWVPDDDSSQKFSIQNSFFTLPENSKDDRLIKFTAEFSEGYRSINLTYKNNYHEKILMSVSTINQIFSNLQTNIFLFNNTYINVSSVEGIFTILSNSIIFYF